jgi:hypothetical protein
MNITIARRATSVLTALGRLSHLQPQDETVRAGASRTEVGRHDTTPSDLRRPTASEPEAVARGVIRREEVPLLARYGTSYGLFDEWIADYECVLISDTYRLGEYGGDSVRVSGPLTDVIKGMPVMKVTHLQLLKMKWMR